MKSWSARIRQAAVPALLLGVAACSEPTAPGDEPDDTPGAIIWAAMSAGVYNSCAVSSDGAAYCWGFDLVAPCTDAGCTVNSVPTRVLGAPALTSISVGGFETCGLSSNGQLWCWGKVFSTTLGDGVTTQSSVPIHIPMPSPIAQVAAGYLDVCALD